MIASSSWEEEHQRREWGRWPSEAVVRFVMRNFSHYHPRHKLRFLDIGCGAGAVSLFLRKEGFAVDAIDGSETAVKRTKQLVNDMTGLFSVSKIDVRELPFAAEQFDCVIDVACLQCLENVGIDKALQEAARVLKPAGRLFSRHASAHGWPGVHTVGDVYPRRVSDLNNIYGKHFICDYMHDCYERSHPTDAIRKVMIAHWNIEGTKR